jgi:hypothetical protein
MKKMLCLPIFLCCIAASVAFAQVPAPDPDTVPPIKEGDPALRQLPPRDDYADDRQRIVPEELPDPVKQTLESSAQYTDWQKAVIYRDKKKEEYIVEFTERGKTTAYRFDKDGRPMPEQK